MLIASISAGLFLRILVVHLANTVTGSNFLLNNKIINILGAVSLLAVFLGAQNPSVNTGVYVGFFLIDALSTFVSVIKLLEKSNTPEILKKKETNSVNSKAMRIAAITANAQVRLSNNKNKLKYKGVSK